MLCQNCGRNEANVSYTQIINGVKKQMKLCSKCAEELGIGNIDFDMSMEVSRFFEDIFQGYDDYIPKLIRSSNLICDNCNMSYEELLNERRFGCDKCYENFESKINRLLKNTQGVDIHNEKLSKKLTDSSENEVKNCNNKQEKISNIGEELKKENDINFKLKELKEKLEKEIKEERYEDAAKTRDEIKKIKKI